VRGRQEGPQAASERVVGVLLCGGRSERMGADKALLDLGGTRLMAYPLAALGAVSDEVLLACGREPRYVELGLALALDPVADGGPLAGLVAGLERALADGAQWACVLACDMPQASAEVLSGLLQRARSQDLDVCLLGLERGSQPAFAVYRTLCAGPARVALEAGERRLVSFHTDERHARAALGRALRVEVVPVEALSAREGTALNVNTPAELERARRSLSAGGVS
jgi:molybdopterin-guanine dinucleotide biosynthesis protein A